MGGEEGEGRRETACCQPLPPLAPQTPPPPPQVPRFNKRALAVHKLWRIVSEHGGYEEVGPCLPKSECLNQNCSCWLLQVCRRKLWATVGRHFNPPALCASGWLPLFKLPGCTSQHQQRVLIHNIPWAGAAVTNLSFHVKRLYERCLLPYEKVGSAFSWDGCGSTGLIMG